MTDEQRAAIFTALMGNAVSFPPGDPARKALEGLALEELNDLEPIIDGFIAEARAGRQRAA